jgi:Family of unknown function (DUF5995)
MEAILSPLAAADGVACFTRLYLAVTRGVQAGLSGVAFADPTFLAQLDEHFAALFFAAVDRPPPAWAPLFDARTRKRIAPLQFALAGMNAHINRDLPVALVQTCIEAGVSLEEASPQHADYVRVNGVLATVEAQVRRGYLPHGVLGFVDRLVHGWSRLDDIVAMWDVARARDAAWMNAEALWALRHERLLADRFLATLDRAVGMAGRGLLLPGRGLL